LAAANELPKYFLNLKDVKVSPSDGRSPVDVELSIECGILWDNRVAKGSKKKSSTGMTTLLTITSDFIFVDFRRTP
jgi:ATP-dependent DNA helicase HFM1/MER3